MVFYKRRCLSVAAMLLGFSLIACGKTAEEGPAERAGKEIDKAIEKAGEAMDKAAEAVKEVAKEAAEKVEAAAKDAAEKVRTATKDK